MPTSPDHNDLFRNANTSNKLDLFQSLLDSGDLTFESALALLNTIRTELEIPQTHRSSIYVRYGTLMVSLHAKMPDVYERVLAAWQAKRGINALTQTHPVNQVVAQKKTAMEFREDFFEAEDAVEEKPVKSVHEEIHAKETNEEPAREVEGAEEGGEAEESEGEAEEEEEHEGEEKEEVEAEPEEESEEEKEDEGEEEEKETEKEKKEEEDSEKPEEKEKESEEAEEEPEEKSEKEAEEEENEPEEETKEIESESGEESEGEKEEASESEAESGEEEEAMIREAGEAAHEMEEVGMEVEGEESPGEEEPPMGAE